MESITIPKADSNPKRRPLWLGPLRAIERARGWKRRLLVLVALGLIAVVGAFLARHASLNDLPDVGDPFDVKAFVESCRVPDERNAFVLYRQAAARLVPLDRASDKLLDSLNSPDYATASPALRGWLEANRESLAPWLEGTARPDALAFPVDQRDARPIAPELTAFRRLAKLAALEATLRIQMGDMAGAWPYLRGIVRSSLHLTRHARLEPLLTGALIEKRVHPTLLIWLGDERTETALVSQAMKDLNEADELLGSCSESLRVEYLHSLHDLLHRPETQEQSLNYERAYRPHPLLFLPGGSAAFWFARNEPTRSLRIVRLAMANWLSQCDKPPTFRAPLAPQPNPLELYDLTVDRTAPAAARALAPSALNDWSDSSLAIRQTCPSAWNLRHSFDEIRRSMGSLRVSVASELYARDQGKQSPDAAALVEAGYLERLPAAYEEVKTDTKP